MLFYGLKYQFTIAGVVLHENKNVLQSVEKQELFLKNSLTKHI